MGHWVLNRGVGQHGRRSVNKDEISLGTVHFLVLDYEETLALMHPTLDAFDTDDDKIEG